MTCIINLGKQPLANQFLKSSTTEEKKYPLDVFLCRNCGHLQLGTLVDRRGIFSDYIYFSSPNPKLSDYFKAYADDVKNRVSKWNKNLVVEIGSNDGILLKQFVSEKNTVLGIDPARNIKSEVPTWREFFGTSVARRIVKEKGEKARVIMANNVLAHTFDMRGMVKGIKNLLHEDGLAVIEAPWLGDMFENNAYDIIYHEHLSYFSISSLNRLFSYFGLIMTDLEFHPVQGKSFRAFFKKEGRGAKLADLAREIIAFESKSKWGKPVTYKKLMKRIEKSKTSLLTKLKKLKKDKKTVVGYGAPAKGNTIINYTKCAKYLDCLIEDMPSKIGLYAPGSHLKVVPRKAVDPDAFVMFAWSYKLPILEKEKDFKGEWIIPNQIK